MANIKFKMILRILFLKTHNINILFGKGTLIQKSYITNKALLTTKQIQIVNLEKFVIAVLNVNNKTFVIYMTIQEQEKIPIHSTKQAQVKAILFNKAFIKVPVEYFDYSNVFLAENAVELLENIRIKEHAIDLEEYK